MDSPHIDKLLHDISPRTGPLIVTVFGDSIAPRGGNIWLGSLITLTAALGLSERSVRTGVYRLRSAGWLAARTKGRSSNYRLTEKGLVECEQAEQRIYAAAPPNWDGSWLLVQGLPDLKPSARQLLRNKLKWLGFGQLSPTLLASPESGYDLGAVLQMPQFAGKVSVFRAKQLELPPTADAACVAAAAWNFTELGAAYATLIDRFENFVENAPAEPAPSFALRTLLIHEYRRILLKDPQLPPGLLPASWNGEDARRLVGQLYLSLCAQADRFVAKNFAGWEESVPANHPSYMQRFRH